MLEKNQKHVGLNQEEVQSRQKQFGLNSIREKPKQSKFVLFLNQFKDFMIAILLGAALLSGLLGDYTDAVIILCIVLLNAIIGFVQENKAEKSMEALKKMTTSQAHVIRNGSLQVISSADLVPDDLVEIEAGNIVPADGIILEEYALEVDESSLTGESAVVEKTAITEDDILFEKIASEKKCFKGSPVKNGRALLRITHIGMQTELGKIAMMLQTDDGLTPLQKRMASFGKKLSYFVLAVSILLFVSGILRGEKTMDIIMLSVSLAVAAIPEALPALITVALSFGASRLAKKNALVRKLPAVETLGSVSFICSDKTGTITQNKMTVTRIHRINSETLSDSLDIALCLNHDVQMTEQGTWAGEPTEMAFVEHIVRERGLEFLNQSSSRFPRIFELPFDSIRKCMTTIHQMENGYLIVTKGASERIEQIVSTEADKKIVREFATNWGAEGIRVLAYGIKFLTELPNNIEVHSIENDLQLTGLIGLSDPARPGVKEAISDCIKAGIRPVMITGDHPATAAAIAREIGILSEGGRVMTGKELNELTEGAFENMAEHISVYARVAPEQKLKIVHALQKKGHFVAMTGDGVNDAPSLKAADIGVAMGINGTDVSKEASDMILLDDNFSTIVKAVREGRRIYDNIKKFVKYIMTCNGAEIWVIAAAPLMALPNPLLPIHILWINLVTDGMPALALAGEKEEAEVMQRAPIKKEEGIFSGKVVRHIIWMSILMAAVTLGTLVFAKYYQIQSWQTMVFTVLAFSQLGHVLSIRSESTFLYKQGLFTNKTLLLSVIITFLLQVAIIYVPFLNSIFKTQALSLQEFGICIGASLIVFHAVELEKWIYSMKKKAVDSIKK